MTGLIQSSSCFDRPERMGKHMLKSANSGITVATTSTSATGKDERYGQHKLKSCKANTCQNVIHLEEKAKREEELRNQIIQEAEDYKQAFYEKRSLNCETNKANNREREKINLANQEKFHKEADKHYWKAIAEIIPREVPNIEKRRGKKEAQNKPSVHVIQGPKPGKPTELARMRQMILKLKQNPPLHMMPPPPKEDKDAKEGKDGNDSKDAKEGKDDKSGKSSPSKQGAAENKPASPAKEGAANGEPEALAVVEGEQAPSSEPSADQ